MLPEPWEILRGTDITGVVLLPDGTPASDAWIRYGDPEQGGEAARRLDDAGEFMLAVGEMTQVRLSVIYEKDGRVYSTDSVVPNPTRDLILKLQSGIVGEENSIVLVVKDASGRKVSKGRCLVLAPGRGDYYDDLWDALLVIPLRDVTGAVSVEIFDPRYDTDPPPLLQAGAAVVGPFKPEPGVVSVSMPDELVIAGRIVDSRGRGVPKVRVSAVVPHKLPRRSTLHSRTTTGFDGEFRLGNLWAGDYRLEFESPEDRPPVSPLTVGSGSIGLRVIVPQALDVRLRILDELGAPVEGAMVSICTSGAESWTDGRVRKEHADAEGRVEIKALGKGVRYSLFVGRPFVGGGHTVGKSLGNWEPADGVIRLE